MKTLSLASPPVAATRSLARAHTLVDCSARPIAGRYIDSLDDAETASGEVKSSGNDKQLGWPFTRTLRTKPPGGMSWFRNPTGLVGVDVHFIFHVQLPSSLPPTPLKVAALSAILHVHTNERIGP